MPKQKKYIQFKLLVLKLEIRDNHHVIAARCKHHEFRVELYALYGSKVIIRE